VAKSRIVLPPLGRGLSARLLALTIIFVLVGEVLIYVPSIARFRTGYLEQRIETARLAALTIEAAPEPMVTEGLGRELLRHAGVLAISLKRPGRRTFILATNKPPEIARVYLLAERTLFDQVGDAFATLWNGDWPAIRVIAHSPKDRDEILVDIVVDFAPLRDAMLGYSWRIVLLSIVLAAITAGLIYFSIHFTLVRPMRRVTESLVAFRGDPENSAADIHTSWRRDEIGLVQRELRTMQEEVRLALRQQARLAAVGAAVGKINHDLRNMLATATLMTDRLAHAANPDSERLIRPLLGALDRATRLCEQTLAFARAEEPTIAPTQFPLRPLIEEMLEGLPNLGGVVTLEHDGVAEELQVLADRAQLFRVLSNLVKNALEAHATRRAAEAIGAPAHDGPDRIALRAELADDGVAIEIEDNGPGLVKRARDHLFAAFAGAGRAGGSGLGLVIARDLVRAHGGRLELVQTGPTGTLFRIWLPGPRV
jgi:signal transduction histidine kinase